MVRELGERAAAVQLFDAIEDLEVLFVRERGLIGSKEVLCRSAHACPVPSAIAAEIVSTTRRDVSSASPGGPEIGLSAYSRLPPLSAKAVRRAIN